MTTTLLSNAKLIAFIPTRDADRARAFYSNTLGIPILQDDGFALVAQVSGVMLRIVRVESFVPYPFTVLGWIVADIDAAVDLLMARNVQFLRYAGMRQSPTGIWISPSGTRVAWFNDPDGNTLSISQH